MRVEQIGGMARAAVILTTAFIIPPSALAEFGPPKTISPAGQDAVRAQIAMAADRKALVVWRASSSGGNATIRVRGIRPDGTLGAIQTISAPGEKVDFPQIAMNGDGAAVIVWERTNDDGTHVVVQARSRSANGMLGPIVNLTAGHKSFSPRAAIAADGSAIVVWQRREGAHDFVQAASRTGFGTFGPSEDISTAGHSGFSPRVAMNRRGDTIVVWQANTGAATLIQARARSAGAAFGATQDLSTPGSNGGDQPAVAIASDGSATAAWVRYSGTVFMIQAASRTGLTPFGSATTLTSHGESASGPQVAVNAGGKAVVAWFRLSGGQQIRASIRPTNGAVFALPQTLAETTSSLPQVAINGDGIVLVAWQRTEKTTSRIEQRTTNAKGGLNAVRVLSRGGQSAHNPQMAMRGDTAIIVWQRPDADGVTRLQISEGL